MSGYMESMMQDQIEGGLHAQQEHLASQIEAALPALTAASPSACICDYPCCACVRPEKTIRAYAQGKMASPMTPEQREECLSEIDAIEGYNREEYEGLGDKYLASGVLDAWTDYARDKGLL